MLDIRVGYPTPPPAFPLFPSDIIVCYLQICIPADWHKLKKLPYEVSISKRLNLSSFNLLRPLTQTLPTGVLLIISSIQLSSNKVNSSQSTPAHSLCQTLGQCRRAKKATEQCNSEGAKNGGKRSREERHLPFPPQLPRFRTTFLYTLSLLS